MRNYFTQSTPRNSQNPQSQLFANFAFFMLRALPSGATGFARTILEQEDNLPAQLPQIFIENHKTEVII
jgi:hypothetical protein